VTRSGFLKWLIGGFTAIAMGGVVYPILRFLKPPTAVSAAIGQVVNIGPVSSFPAGQLTLTSINGKPAIVSNQGGVVTVYSAVCTHLGCVVAPSGNEIKCPCHGSVFTSTGTVTHGPATLPLPTYDARVSGGSVLVGPVNLKRANYPAWYRGEFQ
jgi:Rieske Fe-S protein